MTRRIPARVVLALGCLTIWLVGVRATERSAAAMATAAESFLKSLTPEQRRQVSFPFEGDERVHWHFIPTEMFPRKGLTVKEMTEPQRVLARTLIEAGLSQRGYRQTLSTMERETILGEIEAAAPPPVSGRRLVRDPERYFFSVFGTPSVKGTWGWRVEGHHVSLHFTVIGGKLVASAPTFFGSNPAEIRQGPRAGQWIQAAEEDSARALLMALTAEQRQQAIVSPVALNDIVTMNNLTAEPLTPTGITARALDARRRELLMKIVEVYVGLMASDIAADRLAKVKAAGTDAIAFAWAGDAERGKKHYYRLQGPTFLIEYDNTQNDANHIHSVWRDFNGDFGRDVLREHLKNAAH